MDRLSEDRLLMRVKKNEVNNLRRRGYDIANAKRFGGYSQNGEDIPLTQNPFLGESIDMGIFRAIESTDFRTRKDLSMVYTKEIDGKIHRVVVIYVEQHEKGKAAGKNKMGAVTAAISDGAETHKYHEVIIITPYGVSNPARAEIEILDFKSTFFVDDDLLVDRFHHVAAPISFRLWQGQRTIMGYENPLPADHHLDVFKKEEGINAKNIALLREKDIMAECLGVQEGDVIMCTLPTPGKNAGDTHVEYRLVTE